VKVICARDYDQMCSFAARFVVRRVRENPDVVLGLATGRTMIGFYKSVAARHQAGECSFARVTTFNLDEYVGLPEDDPASYHAYMKREFVERTDVRPDAVHVPYGNAPDVVAAASAYEEAIEAAGGIEIQLLGIGGNGHVAFNEPGSSLASRTRVKRLTPETVHANAPEFGGARDVPRYVMTMGIGTIMDARIVFLLASGRDKAQAVANLVEGPISAWWPASVLQMHRHAFVVVDPGAASLLTHGHDTVEQVLADPFEEYFWEGA
jgi:glucosamine-6-phosphate deaminase